ncbi:MAG: hypothetical protein MJ057_08385 [Sphaerochaetaceae bacterium]|nr:hypothetical protein [Sphaerochaetaceae bacterium]
MESNRRASMARKAFAVLMVLAMAVSAVFASPLKPVGTVGDTKTYDSSYKAANPAEITEGWVIRTAADSFCVANEDLRVEFGANSLAQVISLDSGLELYLLDGYVVATSNASDFTVKTPATVYTADKGTILFVVSDASTETGYVDQGKAVADNKITKEETEILSGNYIDNSYVGFVPEKPQTEMPVSTAVVGGVSEPETVVVTAQEIAPEAQAASETEPEAAVAPTVEETAEAVYLAMVRSFRFENLELTIEANIGQAFIHYPTYVTDIEVINAASCAFDVYGDLLTGVYFEILEPGLVRVTYPETFGPAEFEFAMAVIERELPTYLIMMIDDVEVADFAVADFEAEDFEIDPLFAVEEVPVDYLSADFSFYGIDVSIVAFTGEAFISYPSFITDNEIATAAAAAYAAYGDLLRDIYFEITMPGEVALTYPETYGVDEFNYAVSLLSYELPLYLAQFFETPEPVQEEPEAETVVAVAPQPEMTEPVVEVVVAQEPVVEEAPAVVEETSVEQPAAEPLKTALETVSKEEAAAQVKKANAFRFGAKLSVAYGVDNGTPYSAIDALREKIGTYKKGLVFGFDPYITSKTLTVGLHFEINPFDILSSFPFNPNGITGWTNTVMSYVSEFRFQKGIFELTADRTSELDFTSPIATDLRRQFNNADELLGTMSLTAKHFKLYAFIDDMQLNAKLNGRDQYMGLRAAANIKDFELGASAVANVAKGLKATIIYPAVDAVLPIRLGSTTLTISGGAAAQVNVFAQNRVEGYMAEAKATVAVNAFSFGAGAAYNVGKYFNNAMNNGPCNVTSQFNGKAIDVILSAGINTKVFNVNAEITTPFALGTGSRLAYNTVKTKDGSSKTISADSFLIQADLKLGAFTFSAGAAYDGLCGRLADAAKALISKSNRRAAIIGLIDPQIATYYAVADLSFKAVDIWARADYARLNGSLTLPVSVGLSVKF